MIGTEAKERLRGRIRALGFDEARFANLDPLPRTRLREWLEAGYHADMEWLRRSLEKRLDPSLALEETCSVLMLGVNYYPSDETARQQKGFAKYSLYRDYHDTLLPALRQVGALLEAEYGLSPNDYRYYVDTGPVMERGWAAASGLGWQGKNGMLISRQHGNWLLLATVLLRLEVEPDPPLGRGARAEARPELALHCGTCVRCMEACPTQAIVEPGLVDARRCLSYQTIENKGSIPRGLRSKMGGRVYGCDICLDVCPWNRFARAGRQQLLENRFDVAKLGLLELLRLSVDAYRELFRKMPMKRTKLRGLKRNACVAAGNLRECSDWWPPEAAKDEKRRKAWLLEVQQAVVELASDPEPLVREHAVWAANRLAGSEAAALLQSARQEERHPDVLAEYAAWAGSEAPLARAGD